MIVETHWASVSSVGASNLHGAVFHCQKLTDNEGECVKVMGFQISNCMNLRRFISLPVGLNRARSGAFYARTEARLYPALSLLLDHDWLNKRSMHAELS